jgi:putative tricarboxylic transport membrane protein
MNCLIFVALVILAAVVPVAEAFEPTKPVEIIVHSAPGGGSDLFARAIVEMMQKDNLFHQPMHVINKSGGSGAVAMSYMAGKKGENHTIGLFTSAVIFASLTQKEAQHTIQDLTPVVHLVLEPSVAAVKAEAPYKTMKDFVEAAKKTPGQRTHAGGV